MGSSENCKGVKVVRVSIPSVASNLLVSHTADLHGFLLWVCTYQNATLAQCSEGFGSDRVLERAQEDVLAVGA